MTAVRWQTNSAEGDAYWLIREALARDYATSMLTEETRKSLADVLARWLTKDDRRPTAAEIAADLPALLATSALAVFGNAFIEHVTHLTVDSVMPSAAEKA